MLRFVSAIIFVLAMFILANGVSRTNAAKAPSRPHCEITGSIVKMADRKEAYPDDEWRASMGLPAYVTYTDVTVLLASKRPFVLQENRFTEDELKSECHIESPEEEVFQLADANITKQWVGLKIWGVTVRSGDEFTYGNWLLRALNASSMMPITGK